MDESLEGLLWLLAQLGGNSAIMASLTGGVWPLQAPEGAVPPYGVVTPMAGHDVLSANGFRIFYDGAYQVRFWGLATQSDTLRSVDNAADTLLQHSSGTTANATILSCIRQNPLAMLPDWTGTALRIGVGGLYRVQVWQTGS